MERLTTEKRYSISSQILLKGSPVNNFLVDALTKLKASMPGLLPQLGDFLHITLSELIFNSLGKQAAGVNHQRLTKYHRALSSFLPDYTPIQPLKLYRVFPTLDQPNSHPSSLSLVAAFLTSGDSTIFQVRRDFKQAVEDFNQSLPVHEDILEFKPSNPNVSVVFATLGKFVQFPTEKDNQVSFLEALDQVNQMIPKVDNTHPLKEFSIITTAIEYVMGPYLIVEPSIRLRSAERSHEGIRLLRPWQVVENNKPTSFP